MQQVTAPHHTIACLSACFLSLCSVPTLFLPASQLLASTENWDFDVFDVVKLTKGRPLFFVGPSLCFTNWTQLTHFVPPSS